jgi:hypothetical protein
MVSPFYLDILCKIVRNWELSDIWPKDFSLDVAGRIRIVDEERGIMTQSIL